MIGSKGSNIPQLPVVQCYVEMLYPFVLVQPALMFMSFTALCTKVC